MEIPVQLVHPDAKLPVRGTPFSAGLDLFACEDCTIPPQTDKPILIDTGICMAIPENHVGQIWGRSSMECKYGIFKYAGVIDSDYRGNIKVALINNTPSKFHIKTGDKIAQILIMPVNLALTHQVDELPTTDRGSKGFGSTGK